MITAETQPRLALQDVYQRINPRISLVNEGPVEQRFIEREMDPEKPWSAFGQLMFVKEHRVENGHTIKKIAAISMAYPSGVGSRMTGEILRETLSMDAGKTKRWQGEKEGTIVAMSKQVENIFQEFSLMDRFVALSGKVISERHAARDHEYVQHFFALQDTRIDFLMQVKMDAAEILNTPSFLGRSAFDPAYRDKGIYLIEGFVDEHGIWFGPDPQGKQTRVVDIAKDESHRMWLEWAEDMLATTEGDLVLGDGEDTETVTDCGGRKGCSEFFADMEGKNGESIVFKLPTIQTTMIIPTIATSFSESEKKEMCKGCKHQRSECKCTQEAVAQAA